MDAEGNEWARTMSRCDVCRAEPVDTLRDAVDRKFRCADCYRWLHLLSPNDRRHLRGLRVAF